MAMFRKRQYPLTYMPATEKPVARDDLYPADGSIPKLPRLLPNGFNNTINTFWNK